MEIIELEEWRDIAGSRGCQVSSHGRVKSERGLLSPFEGSSGLPTVGIQKPKSRTNYSVASLVCTAFHGPRPIHHWVHFKDGNRVNARADNVEYRPAKPKGVPLNGPSLPYHPVFDQPGNTRPTVQPKRFTGNRDDFKIFWAATPDIVDLRMDGTTAILLDHEGNRFEVRPGEWVAAVGGRIIVIPWKEPRPKKSDGAP